jgi:hypothetical protein
MFYGHLDYFQRLPLGGSPNTKPGDYGTPKAHICWFYSILSYVKTHMNRIFFEIAYGWGPGHIWFHIALEGPWPHLHDFGGVLDGLWTLPFGLSQFSWFGLLARVCSRPNKREEKTNPQGDHTDKANPIYIVHHGMPLLVGILSLLLRPRLSLAGLTSPVSHVAKAFSHIVGPARPFSIHIASCNFTRMSNLALFPLINKSRLNSMLWYLWVCKWIKAPFHTIYKSKETPTL